MELLRTPTFRADEEKRTVLSSRQNAKSEWHLRKIYAKRRIKKNPNTFNEKVTSSLRTELVFI